MTTDEGGPARGGSHLAFGLLGHLLGAREQKEGQTDVQSRAPGAPGLLMGFKDCKLSVVARTGQSSQPLRQQD